MNASMTHPAHLARRSLAIALAALLAVPFASAQSGDAAALRQLQEENATLRKQLAEARSQATTAPTIGLGVVAPAPRCA